MQKPANRAADKRTREIRVIATNVRGFAVGQDNPAARHPDALVAQVRAMRDGGMTEAAISRATGIRATTIGRWLRGERRATPPARFIARPVRGHASAAADRQSARHADESTTCGDVRNSLRDSDAETLEQLQREGLL
ncbi:hypothetical protein [Roseateles sp.]|uniref:hypothetical protein n=1 Tax=Roseateles sp. TaxID=1971397 RepID=UPI002E014BB2|nr:hypothetical protein [Roseateles sp.]